MFIVSCTICIIISTSVTQSTSLFIESRNQIPVYGSMPNYSNNIIPKTTHMNKSREWNSLYRSNFESPNYKAFSLPKWLKKGWYGITCEPCKKFVVAVSYWMFGPKSSVDDAFEICKKNANDMFEDKGNEICEQVKDVLKEIHDGSDTNTGVLIPPEEVCRFLKLCKRDISGLVHTQIFFFFQPFKFETHSH